MALVDEIHRIYKSADAPFDRLWRWGENGDSLAARHRRFAALCDWSRFKRENDRDGLTRESWTNKVEAYCHKARKLAERLHDQGHGLADIEVTPTPGDPHWGGGNDVMREFVEPFMVKRGLPIGSGKRTPTENDAVGGSKTSDHLTTHTTTMARDFPTFAGEDDARALAHALGFDGWQPNSYATFNVVVDGHTFRVQILWAVPGHFDHVHVGVALVS